MKDIDERILDTIPISIYAKFLSEGGLKISGKELVKYLIELGYFNEDFTPKDKYIKEGYFKHSINRAIGAEGVLRYGLAQITGKGQILLVDKITKHFTKDIL